MKTLNIQVNDIAAISALGGSMLADIIAAQYKVIDDTKDASEMAMPCIAYGQIPQTSARASLSIACTAWTASH